MSYRATKIILAGLFLGGSLMLTSNVLEASSPATPAASDYDSVAFPTNSVGLLNQCGEVFQFSIEDDLVGVVPKGYDDPQGIPIPPMSVPAYGFMSTSPFDAEKGKDAKYGDTEVYSHLEIVRGLWEGYKIIWITDQVNEDAYKFIQNYLKTSGQTDTLVLTWDQERPIPRERNMAFSSWGVTQSCMTFEKAVWEDFLAYTEDPTFARDTENPPVAPLNTDGKLTPWYSNH